MSSLRTAIETNLKAPGIGDVIVADWVRSEHAANSGLEVTHVREVWTPDRPKTDRVARWEITLRGNRKYVEDGLALGASFSLRKPSLDKLPIRVRYVEEFERPNKETAIQISL